jgi:RHS repeat-associated protein
VTEGSVTKTTTYVLDVATPLTMVLSETTGTETVTYLHGLDLVAQSDGTDTRYFAYDALGSVRQVLDDTGAPVLAQTFDPYGNGYEKSGTFQSGWGFTGEQVDGTGFVYLRARYYSPGMGRFMQMDPSRQERNPYLYSYNNPTNYTDPSGLKPTLPIDSDDRDLTDWLIRQLNANLSAPSTADIRRLNFEGVVPDVLQWVFNCPTTVDVVDRAAGKALAFAYWIHLVKDRARYDYKHAIKAKMGESIRLCYQTGCEWLDYSVPGNINYGYTGRAAGFTGFELHSGASYAEVCDPAHSLADKLCPVDGSGYFNTDWALTAFDDPTDYTAVELGIELYSRNPSGVNRDDFERLLGKYLPTLDKADRPKRIYRNLVYGTNYPVGIFDGPNGPFIYTE